MTGIDGNTVLMLHMDGTDGAVDFSDSSANAHVVTANGDVEVDDAQSQFDEAGLFDGSGDFLSVADSNDFAFGSGDCTIDFWVSFNSLSNSAMLYHHAAASEAVYLQYYQPNSTLNFQIYSGGYATTILAPAWTPALNTWYHIALVKNGSTYSLYVNGVLLGSATGGSWVNAAAPVRIGANPDGSRCLDGWLDEYRVSNIARWTSAFTPPSVEYSEPPPPPPVDLGTVRNEYFADKAALLDPDCQLYARHGFSLTVPAGETWYIFNAWKVSFNGSAFDAYHRPIGINEAMAVGEGTVITGTTGSLLWYARPALVQSDERYDEAETLYYERLSKIKSFETKFLHVGRAANTLSGGAGSFPATFAKALVTHTFTHGGCFSVLEGGTGGAGNKERITNIDTEINDGTEFRITNTVLQPFLRSMFDSVFLGAGNRSFSYGVAHTEKTSGGVAYVELPDDGSW